MVESRQAEALALACLFPVLAALFVGARTYSRYLGQNFGWDDWLIYIALALLLGETISIYKYILLSHTGYHVHDIQKQTPEQQVLALKWSFAVQMFYHPMMGAIRASIIQFLFRVRDKRFFIKLSLHVVFWINIGYMVSTTFVNIFQCTPVHYAYMRPIEDLDGTKHGRCIDSLAFILASCALSIIMDLIIIPIPTAMVWNLQMRTKTKTAVVVIMSMGWVATAVSVGRFVVYYIRFSPDQKDKTWDIGVVISIVEPAIGIIAACAPAMKCLIRNMAPRYFSESETSFSTRGQSVPKSGHHRKSSSLHYAMGKEIEQSRVDRLARDEEMYGMRSLGSADSREYIVTVTAGAGTKHETAGAQRKLSVKTGRSDTVEAVPKTFLRD
ncbi:hypothetical protein EJ04DRAFT_117439 [Polyplosphaeria fusca]|uniref:Rhodopsin domain-containing protein n=1 Tax=Polyplosphaeria fusca TaxID=682080 RepID=A0A9P4VA35_9PLEO|nr:hypothetical protein EJ04DRAFT_117439 [Polyplosphaeria fusca]